MGATITKEEVERYKEIVRGKFDDQEIKHLYKLFHRAASSNRMTTENFKSYIESLDIFKCVDPKEEYTQLFRAYSKAKYNKKKPIPITFEEYLEYHLAMTYDKPDRDGLLVGVIFRMYDDDGDGFITKNDMLAVVTCSTKWSGTCWSDEVGAIVEARVRGVLHSIDPVNGKVSLADLKAACDRLPLLLQEMKDLA